MRGGQMSNFLDSVSIFLVSRMSVLASVGISVQSEKLLLLLATSQPGRKSPVSPLQLVGSDKEPAPIVFIWLQGRGTSRMGWQENLLPWLIFPHHQLTAGRLMLCTYLLWQKLNLTGRFLTRPYTRFELLLLFSTFPAQVSLGSRSHLGLITSSKMTTRIYRMDYLMERGCGQSGGGSESWLLSVNSISGATVRMSSRLWAVIKEVCLAHLPPAFSHPAHQTSTSSFFLLIPPMEFSFLWVHINIPNNKIDRSSPAVL